MVRQIRPSMTFHRRLKRFFRERVYLHNNRVFVRVPWPRRRAMRELPLLPSVPKNKHSAHLYATPLRTLAILIAPPKRVDAIVVREPFGRMGNQTIQLVHAISLAERLKTNLILAPGNSIAKAPTCSLSPSLRLDTRKESVRAIGFSRLIRAGLTTKSTEVHLTANTYYSHEWAKPPQREDYTRSFELLRGVSELSSSSKPLPEDHLVIHLRGGDAFGHNAHSDYAQPPLSFYELVVADKNWRKATIVRADESHPFEKNVCTLLDRKGIRWSIQSSSAEEDAAYLARASALVSSRGSFIPAIVGRTVHTKHIYLFGDETRVRGDITIHRITDNTGDYWKSCCQRNWNDSKAQRELMANYPASHLSLTIESN